MVYPEIKTKDKKNSFSIKIKLSKEDITNILTDSESLIELKRTILEVVTYEVDNFIINSADLWDTDIEKIKKVNSALNKVSVTTESEWTPEDVSGMEGKSEVGRKKKSKKKETEESI